MSKSEKIETILLVEDEILILDITTQILEYSGFKVIASEDPLKALELVSDYNGKVDLLLTDVVMPEMNGFQLYTELSKDDPDLKILYMSGHSSKVLLNLGIDVDQVNFIQKPFVTEDLIGKIRSILDS